MSFHGPKRTLNIYVEARTPGYTSGFPAATACRVWESLLKNFYYMIDLNSHCHAAFQGKNTKSNRKVGNSREEPFILSSKWLWDRDSLDGDVGPSFAGSLPLTVQHLNSRLEVSFAQGYPDSFNRTLNQTPVSCKILNAKLRLHKEIYFSWFHSTVNNKPPSVTPESLLSASVKLFIIIQLSDYVCPFVYLSTSETQKIKVFTSQVANLFSLHLPSQTAYYL